MSSDEQYQDISSSPQPEASASDEGTKKSGPKPGAIFIVLLSVVCLLVILFILFMGWTQQGTAPVVEAPVVPEEEPTPSPESTALINDTTLATIARDKQTEIDPAAALVQVIVTENKDVTLATTDGRLLYQLTEGSCTDECLNSWTPYTTATLVDEGRLRSVLVNEEFGLYFLLLDNEMLFTFNEVMELNEYDESMDLLLPNGGFDVEKIINEIGYATSTPELSNGWQLARP